MTTVYFVRHAEADNTHRDGRTRPLTEKGLADRLLVTEFLKDKQIDAVLSSPFRRAVDTVIDFAEKHGHSIVLIEDFRERKSDGKGNRDWLPETDFFRLIARQWADFSYTLSDGECLAEVQARNIAALGEALLLYQDKIIAIGTHGTALSTIINYYNPAYGYEDFMAMVNKLPWVVKMTFDGTNLIGMETIDLVHP